MAGIHYGYLAKAEPQAPVRAVLSPRGRAAAISSFIVRSTKFIPPCQPTLRPSPPSGTAWLHEVKFDGWRIQAHKDGNQERYRDTISIVGQMSASALFLPNWASGQLGALFLFGDNVARRATSFRESGTGYLAGRNTGSFPSA